MDDFFWGWWRRCGFAITRLRHATPCPKQLTTLPHICSEQGGLRPRYPISIIPISGGIDDFPWGHDKATQLNCQRSDRRYRGAAAERRPDRPYRAADDRQDHRQGFLRGS